MRGARRLLLELAQLGAGSGNTRHQRTDRNAERIGCFLVRKVLDRHEVQRLTLFFRQIEKGVAHLLQAHRMFLSGR